MLKEFRDFLMQGNIVALAVAFIAGVAFNGVVASLVNDVIMQIVAAIVGKPSFSDLSFSLNDTPILYGSFLTVLINFVLTMGAVFVFIVKPMEAVTERMKKPVEGAPVVRECPSCLGEVPSKATRCQFCTSDLTPVA